MSKRDFACCFTGHRIIANEDMPILLEDLKMTIEMLILEYDVKYFCVGGALGFDTMCAKAVLELKETYPHIQLILILPCKNQTEKWKEKDVKIYNDILSKCDNYIYVSEEYTKDCMLKRNRKMVDCTKYVITYLRRNFGGSAYTKNYAQSQGKTIISL
ncbi:MAG: DUF1273 family protein [Clostridia bacterium]|nr:DUF1273 family protein [Clostridia bacterium]